MAVKVGDVVAWADVPDESLVRATYFERRTGYAIRSHGMGEWVNVAHTSWAWDKFHASTAWPWNPTPVTVDESVTIIALDVPANATADELRRLAEVFEVRQALLEMWGDRPPQWNGCFITDYPGFIAERLHAAGWRPGMTAEDAARLLAEVRDGEG